MTFPASQRAVQLTGPGRLELNEQKPVSRPGPHQILARIELSKPAIASIA